MDEVSDDFRARVYEIVSHIPRGKVMYYGQIAALVSSPRAARIVGGVAHWGDPDLPWQRVVMKDGRLAYPGGVAGHRVALEEEGIEFTDDNKVNMSKHLWQPPNPNQNSLL